MSEVPDPPGPSGGEGQAGGGDPARQYLTARRQLPAAANGSGAGPSTSTAQQPSTASPSPVTNFIRSGNYWSYIYEYDESRLFVNGTGDIPDPITRTTEHGVERITFDREGAASSTMIAPPGTSFTVSGFSGTMDFDEGAVTLIGGHVGPITFRTIEDF